MYQTETPYKSPLRNKSQQDKTFARQDSPNSMRIKLLQEKWSTLQNDLDREKLERRQTLEEQVISLEEKIRREQPLDMQKLQKTKDVIVKIQDQIMNERNQREVFDERKTKELKNLQDGVYLMIQEEIQNKNLIEEKIINQSDTQIMDLKTQIETQSKTFDEVTEVKSKEIIEKLDIINEIIDEEKKQREESSQILMQKLEDELNSFQEKIAIEQKIREETQNRLFRMIEDFNLKLQEEIQVEKKDREHTNEALLKLLEDTCNKIDKDFSFK